MEYMTYITGDMNEFKADKFRTRFCEERDYAQRPTRAVWPAWNSDACMTVAHIEE